MKCISANNHKDDDEASRFSVDSFKNRYHLARNILISVDENDDDDDDLSSCNSDHLIHTNTSSTENSKDVHSIHMKDGKLHLSFTTSKGDNSHSKTGETSHDVQHPRLPHGIPVEIALLHEETASLLDSVSADDSKHVMSTISPIKDQFYHEDNMVKNSIYAQLYDVDEGETDVHDDTSDASLISDDDGTKNEVKKLKYVVRMIRRDMSQLTYHYDNLIHSPYQEQEVEEKMLSEHGYRSVERLIIMLLLVSIYFIHNNIGFVTMRQQFYSSHVVDKTSELLELKNGFTHHHVEESIKTHYAEEEIENICKLPESITFSHEFLNEEGERNMDRHNDRSETVEKAMETTESSSEEMIQSFVEELTKINTLEENENTCTISIPYEFRHDVEYEGTKRIFMPRSLK